MYNEPSYGSHISMEAAPQTAAILVIGNEILSGKVDEANVAVLARALRGIGVLLKRAVVVLDDVDAIASEVKSLSASHDWLFTSGGVGPTHDDVTVEAVAKAFEVGIVLPPLMEQMLRQHYGRGCTEGHLRMALVPEGAALETTTEVTWPTIRLRNTWLLPGIPHVFRLKVNVVVAVLSSKPGIGRRRAFVSHAVYSELDEGNLKPMLDRIVAEYPDVSVGSYPEWMHPKYKTKLTFDGRDEGRVLAARNAFVALLPAGEPKHID